MRFEKMEKMVSATGLKLNVLLLPRRVNIMSYQRLRMHMECLQHHGPPPQAMFCLVLAELLYDLIIVIPMWACRAYKSCAVSDKTRTCVQFEQQVINVLTKLRLYVSLWLKPWAPSATLRTSTKNTSRKLDHTERVATLYML